MSQIPPPVFFFSGKTTFYLKMKGRNDTKKSKNINISSLKYNFKGLRQIFELMQVETQRSKNYFTIFLWREVGASEGNADLKQ